MDVNCFGCSQANPQQSAFCSSCGAPLTLSKYIEREVDARLTDATRERELIELESSVRIFEKAYGWAKLVGGIVTGVAALLVAGATYETFNLRSAVEVAKTSVESTKKDAEKGIADSSNAVKKQLGDQAASSLSKIDDATAQATSSSLKAQRTAQAQTLAVSRQTALLKSDLASQGSALNRDLDSARTQLKAANELEPSLLSMEQQLSAAQAQIREQQRVITSSEDFAKKIFSSYKEILIDLKKEPESSHVSVDMLETVNLPSRFVFYVILPDTPVQGTVRLQFSQTPAAGGSFFAFHNILLVAIRKDAREELLGKIIDVSYFPDPQDRVHFSKLEVKGGLVYADDQLLPKGYQATEAPPPPAATPNPASPKQPH